MLRRGGDERLDGQTTDIADRVRWGRLIVKTKLDAVQTALRGCVSALWRWAAEWPKWQVAQGGSCMLLEEGCAVPKCSRTASLWAAQTALGRRAAAECPADGYTGCIV